MEETKEKKMTTLEDKLEYIDQELRLLHKFCLDSGYSPREVEKFAEPFLGSVKSVKRKKTQTKALGVAVLIALFAAALYIDPAYKVLAAAGRQLSIKLIPIWDWTQMYEWDCLMDNPLFEDGLTTDECQDACESLKELERVNNISQEDIADSYIKKGRPVIVVDGMADWPETTKEISIKKLYQLFSQDKILKEHEVCSLSSVGIDGAENSQKVLEIVTEKSLQNYYINWENCAKDAAKAFRAKFFRRPYFLPQLVEIFSTNMVFVSDNYEGEDMIQLPGASKMLIMIQMKGQTGFKLTPTAVCEDVCEKVISVIKEGEILIVPSSDQIYEVTYLPHGPESIVIGIYGDFD